MSRKCVPLCNRRLGAEFTGDAKRPKKTTMMSKIKSKAVSGVAISGALFQKKRVAKAISFFDTQLLQGVQP